MLLLSSVCRFISCLMQTVALFVSECYSSFTQIVWRHFYFHLVARQNPDVVHPHFSGYVCNNGVSVFEFNFEHRIGQCFHNYAVLLYRCLFCHTYAVIPNAESRLPLSLPVSIKPS